jgi:glycine cleavage system H protein
MIYYTEDHEWIEVENGVGTVGITAYAAEQLGDVVFVEVPEAGKTLGKGDEAAVVESVKAASEIYSPVSGEIVEGNEELPDNPEKVSDDPEGDGWFFKIQIEDAAELEELMDDAAYKEFLKGLD